MTRTIAHVTSEWEWTRTERRSLVCAHNPTRKLPFSVAIFDEAERGFRADFYSDRDTMLVFWQTLGTFLGEPPAPAPVKVDKAMVDRLRERIQHHCWTDRGYDWTDLAHALEQTLDPSLIGKF